MLRRVGVCNKISRLTSRKHDTLRTVDSNLPLTMELNVKGVSIMVQLS